MSDIDNIDSLKQDILEDLENSKARDIVIIDLDGKSDVCNYMIIASGTSDRHVKSIADKLTYHIKHHESQSVDYSSEGLDEGKWILIDTPAIIIHIFQPEVREFYNLEELWGDSKNINRKEKHS